MKLFEATFVKDNWDHYCRYFNTDDNQSYVYKIMDRGDGFVEDPNGDYTHILSKKKYSWADWKYKKRNPDAKIECKCNAGLVHIRNNYWKFEGSNYNTNPGIFYLDIETTAKRPVDVYRCPEEIVSIQIFHNITNTVIYLYTGDSPEPKTENGYYKFDKTYDFKIHSVRCYSEEDLLRTYFKVIRHLKPLIVIAHNGEGFDFRYMWERTRKLGVDEGFSPWGPSQLKDKSADGKAWFTLDAPGVFYLDNLVLYKRFRLAPRSSYSLDSLAEVELGERKVDHSCYSTFDGFRTGEGYIRPTSEPAKDSHLEYALYHAKSQDEIASISKEWFAHYSIIDVYLLYKMDSKLKLTSILIGLASITGVNINSALGTVMPWGNYIRNYCYTQKIVVPGYQSVKEEPTVVGGYVKDPIAGKYEWVYVVDVTSMYPSQMMAFNMSPDTFVPRHLWPEDLKNEVLNLELSTDEQFHLKEYFNNPQRYSKLTEILKKHKLCGSLNGAFFRRDYKGVIPILVEHVFNQRKSAKKEMLQNEKLFESTSDEKYKTLATELNIRQNALKIAINGLYGALGNPAFDLFNEDIANAITSNARFYVQLFSKNIEVKTQDICTYGDTDAGDFAVSRRILDIIKNLNLQEKIDYIDNYIETEVQPIINGSSKELGDIFNALDSSKISAKREVIAEKAIFIAKKRYIMKIWDSEGVRFKEPHLKMMGIDLVRSSTPAFSKKYLKDSIEIILESTESDILKFINSVRDKFLKEPLSQIAKVSSINNLNYEKGSKGIPINSRAAMVSNEYIAKNCANRFAPLQVGEKVKMLYLKKRNPLGENIFAFVDENFANLFKDYIDYDLNFEKFFLKPLEIMTGPLKFNVHKNTEALELW